MKTPKLCLALLCALAFPLAASAQSPADASFEKASPAGQLAYCAALDQVLAHRLADHVAAHGIPTASWLRAAKDNIVGWMLSGVELEHRAAHDGMANSTSSEDESFAAFRTQLLRDVPADYRDTADFAAVSGHQCRAALKRQQARHPAGAQLAKTLKKNAQTRGEALADDAIESLLDRYRNNPTDQRVLPDKS